MTGPFAVLGIPADADERAVKIAYAKLLKATRPDDDPEGFQRLNAAYRQALRHAQGRTPARPARSVAISSAPLVASLTLAARGSAAPVPTGEPAGGPAAGTPQAPVAQEAGPASGERSSRASAPGVRSARAPRFDPQEFLAEYRRTSAGGAAELARWLNEYPAFWHLHTKHAAGQWLLRTLFNSPLALPEGCFSATAEFFHYEDAITGADPMALRRVGTRINAASLVLPENARTLAGHAFGNRQPGAVRSCKRALGRLSRPWRWWRDGPAALWPSQTGKLARVANALCAGNPDDLPPPIDRACARFWMDACNPAAPRARRLLALYRCIAWLLIIPLVVASFVGAIEHASEAPGPFAAAFVAWQITTALVGVMIAFYWVPIGFRWLSGEADALAARLPPFRVLMACLTPAGCALALALAHWRDPALGTLMSIVVMFAAIWRLRAARLRSPLSRLARVALVVAFFAYLVGISALANVADMDLDPGLLPVLATCGIALGAWVLDWSKRGFLRPRVGIARPRRRI